MTVGLHGFGKIPQEVAKYLSNFGVKVLACDPYGSKEIANSLNVTLVDFDTLITQSDILSLHAPLLPSTKGLFNKDVFKKMKPSAFLINCSRGPEVNQKDLYEALTEKWIAGAALDVMENEPPIEEDKKLIELPNVIVTGHSAFYTDESKEDQLIMTAKEVGSILRGEIPKNLVNKEVLNVK